MRISVPSPIPIYMLASSPLSLPLSIFLGIPSGGSP
jgi:hypothetical protein